MNPSYILDAFGVIAYFEDGPGARRVGALIKRAQAREEPLLLCVVNWGEVYYAVCRNEGRAAAERVLRDLETLPVELVPADRALSRRAAEIKSTRKLSYADCFAAALAEAERGELVTGDLEFREVENLVKVVWI